VPIFASADADDHRLIDFHRSGRIRPASEGCGLPAFLSITRGFTAESANYSVTNLSTRDCSERLRWFASRTFLRSRKFFGVASSWGADAEVQKPLALVVIVGLLSSKFLKLILLPGLYDWAESKSGKPSTEIAKSIT